DRPSTYTCDLLADSTGGSAQRERHGATSRPGAPVAMRVIPCARGWERLPRPAGYCQGSAGPVARSRAVVAEAAQLGAEAARGEQRRERRAASRRAVDRLDRERAAPRGARDLRQP